MQKLWPMLLLFAMGACGDKNPATQTLQTEPDQEVTAPISAASPDFQDMPTGAVREELTDTPGLVYVYIKNGPLLLSLQGYYKDGKRHGNWIEYHPNGMIKTITPYIDGKREGMMLTLNNNGAVEKRCMYHNDLRHGEYKEYNYAQVKEERMYVNDQLEGLVKIYYQDGKIMEEGSYQGGTRHGISKWYDQNGNLSIQYEYSKGELVKK
jgi:antitoxin component YwqK of YwqJK toxin-antitoxin module